MAKQISELVYDCLDSGLDCVSQYDKYSYFYQGFVLFVCVCQKGARAERARRVI